MSEGYAGGGGYTSNDGSDSGGRKCGGRCTNRGSAGGGHASGSGCTGNGTGRWMSAGRFTNRSHRDETSGRQVSHGSLDGGGGDGRGTGVRGSEFREGDTDAARN